MHDYDVIVRIPIRAMNERDAYVEAMGVSEEFKHWGDDRAQFVRVECTGPSEE